MTQKTYYVYILINDEDHTYIGITNNLEKRLEAHITKTGAKATKKSTSWKYYKIYGMFTRPTALRFEWYCKHEQSLKTGKWRKTKSGIENKIKNINKLLTYEEWKNIKEIIIPL
jgi:predicted GIY-YIG superfamily endonuclease